MSFMKGLIEKDPIAKATIKNDPIGTADMIGLGDKKKKTTTATTTPPERKASLLDNKDKGNDNSLL